MFPASPPPRALGALLAAVLLPALAQAQWSPPSGQWGKLDATDVRVMTWNVHDGLCSTNDKSDGLNNWSALARIVADLQPDVLLLQECGDNNGNGTGSGDDSVSVLTTTVGLFLHGGPDPFNGGSVGAYVQKYAPSYDLPHVFVSSSSDGFNRNVMLSRFPFSDLNGDGKSTLSDIPNVSSDAYAPGGDGGIRGFQFVELDLPSDYDGDLVVGGAHLKAGSGGSDHDQRVEAAQNVAYYVDYLFNGAGTGTPDPNGKIADSPSATSILGPATPVVLGGDWNEDEASNGTKGPADWLTKAAATGGTDGTDRDRSDMVFDSAQHFFTGDDDTIGNVKFDYLAWQDSIVAPRLSVVFDTNTTPASAMPAAVNGFPTPVTTSSWASDHLPVFCDLILPRSTGTPLCFGDATGAVCPCINWGAPGEGCGNSQGHGAILSASGSSVVANDDLVLHVAQARPDKNGVFLQGAGLISSPFRDGILCVGNPTERLEFTTLDPVGSISSTVSIVTEGLVAPGQTRIYQFWYRDGMGPCNQGSNLTGAFEVVWQ